MLLALIVSSKVSQILTGGDGFCWVANGSGTFHSARAVKTKAQTFLRPAFVTSGADHCPGEKWSTSVSFRSTRIWDGTARMTYCSAPWGSCQDHPQGCQELWGLAGSLRRRTADFALQTGLSI